VRTVTDRASLRPTAAWPAAAWLPAALVLAAAGVVVTLPRQYRIEGLSMAPGLLPGDVVQTGLLPSRDTFRRPRRFERWIVAAPDGTPAIKRVIGLPGETISIVDGDLAIDGLTVLTPPTLLAATASRVPRGTDAGGSRTPRDPGPWLESVPPAIVYDDAECAPAERRTLLPVRDVGLAAVVRIRDSPAADAPLRVLLRVGPRVVPWRIEAAGRYAAVAGRLDGRLVGAAWPIADPPTTHGPRTCLPPGAPTEWQLAMPWPTASDGDQPMLALGITADGLAVDGASGTALVEQFVVWRDLLHRPAADGVVQWRLGSDAFFVLGDFPSASRDSRQWGPLGRRAFQARASDP